MSNKTDTRKKENVLNLEKFIDKSIHVKFHGGREVSGILKGCDTLMNLVIDQAKEYLTDLDDPYKLTGKVRKLGLVVCRGTSINMVTPREGMEQIDNPFQIWFCFCWFQNFPNILSILDDVTHHCYSSNKKFKK